MLFTAVKDKAFGGTLNTYTFLSSTLGNTWSTFAVFLPPGATLENPAPVIWYFPGIMVSYYAGYIQCGLYRQAAKRGLAIVFPDSSPRGTGLQEELEDYRLGPGAAYGLDATAEPWCRYYKHFTHITEELPRELKEEGLPLDFTRQACIGHSGGGHTSMQLHLLKPESYSSASGMAPFCDLMRCEIGRYVIPRMCKGGFEEFEKINVPELVRALPETQRPKLHILVSSGTEDIALRPGGMCVDSLEAAVKARGLDESEVRFEWDEGYTHSYHYNATIATRHIDFHADILSQLPPGRVPPPKVESSETPPWTTRKIKRKVDSPKGGQPIGEWINHLKDNHEIFIVVHGGVEAQAESCERAEQYIQTRPWPDDEILCLDIHGHPNQKEIEEYFLKEKRTRYWPACFTHGSFWGGPGNLVGTTIGYHGPLSRAGP